MQGFDTAVMIGRFAPWRHADTEHLNDLLSCSQRVVVVIGSAGEPRSVQTPWTAHERAAMIRSVTGDNDRVSIVAVEDYLYRPKVWSDIVRHHAGRGRIGVTGADDLFSDWQAISRHDDAPTGPQVRAAWLSGDTTTVAAQVAASVADIMNDVALSPDGEALRREYAAVVVYRASWSKAPYDPILSVVDACVVHRDVRGVARLLLVERGGDFGAGLLADPGGFVEADETLLQAAWRELREETRLDLAGITPTAQHVFDYPYRSPRGRVISQGFRFDLTGPLPRVTGGDDARAAQWVPVETVWGLRERLFEDHYSIIDHLLQDLR